MSEANYDHGPSKQPPHTVSVETDGTDKHRTSSDPEPRPDISNIPTVLVTLSGTLRMIAADCRIALPGEMPKRRKDIEALMRKSAIQRVNNTETALEITLVATIAAAESLGVTNTTMVGTTAVAQTLYNTNRPASAIPLLRWVLEEVGVKHPKAKLPLLLLIACAKAIKAPPSTMNELFVKKYLHDTETKAEKADLAEDLKTLADSSFQCCDFKRAVSWLLQVLPLDIALFGEEHTQVGVDHACLAKLHLVQQNFDPAIEHNLKALDIFLKTQPDKVPEILSILERLFRKVGKPECAERCRAIGASLDKEPRVAPSSGPSEAASPSAVLADAV